MEIAIETLVAVSFLIIGLSHLLQPRAWSDFFIRLRDKGVAGSLQLGLLHLPLALLIISFHNVWHGLPVIVTLIGWSQLLKGAVYLIWPAHASRMMGTISVENSWRFVLGGLFALALSGAIFFSIWRTS